MHELGHVLGAIHPGTSDDNAISVPEGKSGVMCKDSCAPGFVGREGLESTINKIVLSGTVFGPENVDLPDKRWIFNARFYSEPNKKRILELDDDYMDGNGEARNLTSVATATSK
jgi:hypothetical protein